MHVPPRLEVLVALLFAAASTACAVPGDADDGGDDVGDSCGTDCADSSSGEVPSTGCPALDGANGSGTTWDTLSMPYENITMTAAGSPHLIPAGTLLIYDVTLEVEPCAVVRLGARANIDAVGTGRVVARGTADAPILFEAIDPEAPWANLSTGGFVGVWGGFLDLAHVTLVDAGGDDFFPGAIYLADNDVGDVPVERARVQDVLVDGSRSYGVSAIDGAVFSADSANLTVRGAASSPVYTDYLLAGHIPPGDYGDNEHVIRLANGYFAVQPTLVFRDRGVPYELGDPSDGLDAYSISVTSSAVGEPVNMTIEPGVELRFGAGQSLTIGDGAALDARGTADAPIVLTSSAEAPQAGDWYGVVFDGAPGAGTALEHVEIAYAGQSLGFGSWSHCAATDIVDGDEGAALVFTAEPASGVVTSSTIRASASHGINRAWAGAAVDLAIGNTFEDVALCDQTEPSAADGTCPEVVTCGGA